MSSQPEPPNESPSAIQQSLSGSFAVQATVINHVRLGSLCVYEISEHELEQLEQGQQTSLQLNFAVALIPLGISILVTIFTADFRHQLAQVFFMVLMIISFVLGAYFGLSWWRTKPKTNICERIRSRIPPNVGP